MKEFVLQSEGKWAGEYEDRSEHDTYDEAVEAAGSLFDDGDDGDYRIKEKGTGSGWRLRGYTFQKEECPVCGKEVRHRDMVRTSDCHGIPYRLVCGACYDHIMNKKGFDGEQYSEADECLDYDY